MKTTSENGVTTNQNDTQGKYLSIGGSVGFFLTNRLIAGVGLDYNWGKEIRYNLLSFNGFTQAEETFVKSKIFLPNFYLGYYYPITNKLFFNTNLKFSYGKLKSEVNTSYGGYSTSNTSTSLSYITSVSQDSEYNYFSFKVSPELTYFISAGFGLYLGLGGIEYTAIDWKKDNSSWTVNFNPSYWRLGIKVKL
jgi:hypothetical protein